MEVLVVGHAEVPRLLPMSECIEVMTTAFRALARRDVVLPLRPVMWLPERVGALGMMPGYLGDPDVMGIKVVSVFPGNVRTPYESHQGAVLLFDTRNGSLLALVDAGEITAIRTAAVSGLATRLLARPDAGDLAIQGAGAQAHAHLEAMRLVRDIRRVRVWSRTPENARRFAQLESHAIPTEAVATPREAVEGADLICTTTSAREPVLLGDWIAPGAHINAVGSCVPVTRELDTAAVARSRLFVDCLESALHEAGDFIIPKEEGAIDDDHIQGEVCAVLVEQIPGRRTAAEVTLFESLGLAIEDIATAHHVFEKAKREGAGTRIEIGGLRRAAD
ncbi:MAG: ornithine cyclodeaminase family protein [Candidatus Krumholzibacteriia bacterium]